MMLRLNLRWNLSPQICKIIDQLLVIIPAVCTVNIVYMKISCKVFDMRLIDINKERLNIMLLSCCSLFFLLLPLSGMVVYSTSDDYMYLLITSGAYTGTPSPYTVVEGYLYSSFIAFLYRLTNQLEWYSIVQHLLSVLSFVIISWQLLKSKIEPFLVYIFFSVFFVVQLNLLLSPQNTLCAAELSLASLVILLNCRGNIPKEFLALLLFLIGAEIRFQAVFIPFIVLFPLIIYSQEKRSFFSKESFHTVIILICMVIGAFSCRAYTGFIYNSDNDWSYYYKYSNVKGYLNDNSNAINAIKLFHDDNKKKEYELILNYRVNDGNIVTADDLEKCANYLKDSYSESILSNIVPYILMIIKMDGLWAFAFCVLLACEMIRKQHYKLLMILLWGILAVLSACLVMASMSFAKERTVLPLLAALYFMMIWCSAEIYKRYFRYLLISFSLIVIINWGNRVRWTCYYNPISVTAFEEINAFLSDVPTKKLLVHSGPTVRGDAFHYSQSPMAQKLVRSGWLTNSPITKVHYTGFLSYIQGLPYIYAKSQVEFIEKTQSLIKSYYGIDTERVVILENEDFAVEKLVVLHTTK